MTTFAKFMPKRTIEVVMMNVKKPIITWSKDVEMNENSVVFAYGKRKMENINRFDFLCFSMLRGVPFEIDQFAFLDRLDEDSHC